MHAERFERKANAPGLAGVLIAGALALSIPLNAAHAGTKVSQCQIAISSAGRLSVTYTAEGKGKQAAKQFDADLELTPGEYKKGQKVKFLVKGVEVASQRLKLDKNGDLEADVKLTTKKKKGRKAWPDDFPRVKPGTTVATQIGETNILSCVLF